MADYLKDSAASIYRRRRRRRAEATLVFVILLLIATVAYAGSYVQGWVSAAPTSVTSASCNKNASPPPLRPRDVRLNVYNATTQPGLAAAVAVALQKQGFDIGVVGNDPLGRTVAGVGEIRSGDSGVEGSNLVARRLPKAVLLLDDRMDASVDLVVGSRYRVLTTPHTTTRGKKAKALPRCSAPS